MVEYTESVKKIMKKEDEIIESINLTNAILIMIKDLLQELADKREIQ